MAKPSIVLHLHVFVYVCVFRIFNMNCFGNIILLINIDAFKVRVVLNKMLQLGNYVV